MLQWSRLHTTAWNKLYRKKKSHDPSSVQGSDSNNNKKEYAVWKSSKHYKTLLPADTQHPIGHLSTAPGTNSSANKKLDSRSDTERERTTVHATLSTHFIFFLLFHFFSLLNTCFFFFLAHTSKYYITGVRQNWKRNLVLWPDYHIAVLETALETICQNEGWWMTSGKKVSTPNQR